MKKVCVITGGGSGMGLATAKLLGQKHFVIICGRTVEKLESAIRELRDSGAEAEAMACDVSDPASVAGLVAKAKERGPIAAVIHAAGMSPHMGNAETLVRVNALGTIHISEAFYKVMEEGSCLIDIASMAGHISAVTEADLEIFKLSRSDKALFVEKMMERISALPEQHQAGVAYCLSKSFVIWYAKTGAAKFGEKGARVFSISPGCFETPMGEAEKESSDIQIQSCALKRYGKVEEIASLIAFCAGNKVGYLTGTDILCDGGYIASRLNA